MLDLLPSPWGDQFDAMLDACRSSLILCSPYVSRNPCERVIRRLDRLATPPISVHLITDLSPENLLSGATDAAAILAIADSLPCVSVHYLPRLHAKVYIRDSDEAVVTSGNLTDGGLLRNHELGVQIKDSATVARVRSHVLNLSELGAPVPMVQLQIVSAAASELRDRWQAVERSARKDAKQAFEERVGQVKESLLELRVTHRSVAATFADTVLFLLRSGPLATPDIHREVQRLHPDLCDDSIDRVIKGQRFGKKWKHAVRTAQAHLKESGKIALVEGRWRAVS